MNTFDRILLSLFSFLAILEVSLKTLVHITNSNSTLEIAWNCVAILGFMYFAWLYYKCIWFYRD